MMMRKEMTLSFIKIISHFYDYCLHGDFSLQAEEFGDVIFLVVRYYLWVVNVFSHFITHDYASN